MTHANIKRKKRLFQLKAFFIFLVISVFLNGILVVSLYMQKQNVQAMKQRIAINEESLQVLDEQNNSYRESVDELTNTVLSLQADVAALRSQLNARPVSGEKIAYLTFDDGPTTITPAILDVLAQYDVKATFFVLGINVMRRPEIIKRIVAEGHTVGIHSNTHKYEQIYQSVESLRADIAESQRLIYEAAGIRAAEYRFPGGSSNTMFQNYGGAIPRQDWFDLIHEMGMEFHDWNVSSLDASANLVSSSQIVQSVVNGAQHQPVINVLFHDVVKNTSTVEALPEIIVQLKEKGYVFSALTSNSIAIQHKIAE